MNEPSNPEIHRIIEKLKSNFVIKGEGEYPCCATPCISEKNGTRIMFHKPAQICQACKDWSDGFT